MNKNKGKRGGRSARGNGRGGGASRQQSKQQQPPTPEPVMDTTAATPPPPSAGGEYAQQTDEDGKQIGKYKTKLCVFHASPQGCPYGTECLFAHGTFSLLPRPNPVTLLSCAMCNVHKHSPPHFANKQALLVFLETASVKVLLCCFLAQRDVSAARCTLVALGEVAARWQIVSSVR